MADLKKDAATSQIVELLTAYGVGVRAGVLTPCPEDEIAFRSLLGLPPMPALVAKDWRDSDGVRRPITLGKPDETDSTTDGQDKKESQNV